MITMLIGRDYRLVAVLVGLCIFFPMSLVDARDFTSKNGSVMQAELVSHKNDKVKIRRTDGKEYDVDPSIFSADDERFIRKWMKVHPETLDYSFTIEADKKVVDRSSYGSYSGETFWSYEIKINNNSQDTIPYLKVLYKVLYTTPTSRIEEGQAEMKQELKFNRSLVVTTEPVRIYKTRYYRSSYRNNELKGCLVRLVDRNGKVIQEWVSQEVGMKDVTWDNCNPAEVEKPKTEIR